MQNVQHLELTTFEELFHAICENKGWPIRVNNNTYAQFTGDTDVEIDGDRWVIASDTIQISLHGSAIVILTRDTISVSLCGYNTPTTRKRISDYLPFGATITCKKGECFITLENGTRAQVPTSEGTNPSNGYVHMSDKYDEEMGEWVHSFETA